MLKHTLTEQDPLWVPLLAHYRTNGDLDHARMEAHLTEITPHVSQIMLAGSTGDGWEMDDHRFQSLIEFAAQKVTGQVRVMFGALAADTASVIARIRMVEDRLADEPSLRQRYVGVTVCPPMDPAAAQSDIISHYKEVLRQTSSPVSLYQLPQVTGCKMSPETVQELAGDPRMIMFKDSSGEDEVATSGRDYSPNIMLRGAEGGYAEAVAGGGYNGWLLSTANVFGEDLRQIEAALRSGNTDEAKMLSDRLSKVVLELFDAAADEKGANAFSNANRAADHLRAHGANWKSVPPPLKQDNEPVTDELVASAATICKDLIDLDGPGYLNQ